jgi:DNA-binding NtrC family response regulator
MVKEDGMSRTVEEVVVVSFAGGSMRDSLRDALSELGHKVRLLDGEAWLAGPAMARRVILVLGAEGYPRDRLLAFLGVSDKLSVLAAFTCDSAAWDERLLSACSDFFGWPCHRTELSYRVDRLVRAAGSALSRSIEPDVLDQCVQLNMLGQSPVFLEAVNVLRKFARCDAPVLIEGETGTGKELAARAIHYLGARRDYPFVPVNCGAIPDNLLENELFGHERGAFTDAKERQAGLVEQANEGTLFFDEVDALSEKGQVALLRFLEEQEYRPLGGKSPRKADVRIVAATNVDLRTLSDAGRFRRDLMFRLHVLTVGLPPLRERGQDIRLLAEHFLDRYRAHYRQGAKMLDAETVRWMLGYPWNGNVRELENLLHRYYLLNEGSIIRIPTPAQQGAHVMTDGERDTSFREAKARAIAAFEACYLRSLLAESGGNISLAARRAGKDRSALRRLLHKHGVSR